MAEKNNPLALKWGKQTFEMVETIDRSGSTNGGMAMNGKKNER